MALLIRLSNRSAASLWNPQKRGDALEGFVAILNDGFSDILDIHNPQFADCMVRPECDKPIPDKEELHLSSGFI